jgi:hydrogenase/urease accessory protein HupE
MSSWFVAVALLAHNPDTSYARLTITPEEVQTRLTYDVFTLLKIVELDNNRDQQLQRDELQSHVPRIVEFLRSKIGLALSEEDETAELGEFQGIVWPPDVGTVIPAADYHSANGLIHFDFVRKCEQPPQVAAIAFGFFQDFTERHTILGVFICSGDEYETTFTSYEDYFEYSTGFDPPAPPPGENPAPVVPQTRHGLVERLWRFFKMGVEHIFIGYDHICFLIALLVVSRFREVVKIVTSFTVAHSITLILAALDVVTLPSRLIETGIALTIVYVALENVWMLTRASRHGNRELSDAPPSVRASTPLSLPTSHRWKLTFVFGLIHGFGFANVLRELGLPTVGLVRSLLAFNVGVEVGQIAIALGLLPLAIFLAHWRHGDKVALVVSCLLALFGAGWFLDRALSLEIMPI